MIGLNTSLTMSGEVRDIWRNPAIRAEMKGQVDFTRLAKEFLNPDTLLLEGTTVSYTHLDVYKRQVLLVV